MFSMFSVGIGVLLILLANGESSKAEEWSYETDDIGVLMSMPRLAFHPTPDGESNLIRFERNKPETYIKYINTTTKILSEYRSSRWNNWIDCENFNKYRPEEYHREACHIKLSDLGEKCFKDSFGYKSGQPCILFNLERIYNWLPVPYSNSTVPDNIRDLWSQYAVTLKCDTKDPPSHDNIGQVEYYPRDGFHFKYFPYTGQPGWRQPLVFVRFANLAPSVTVFIECKIYARHIKHSPRLDTGMVSFELLVD